MNLHGRQVQFLDDGRVLELHGFVDGLALDPFGDERGRRDGAAAAEGLELGVLDHAGLGVDLDLQPHHVAASGRPTAWFRSGLAGAPGRNRTPTGVKNYLEIQVVRRREMGGRQTGVRMGRAFKLDFHEGR